MSNLFKKLFNRKVSKANKRFDEALKEINLKTVKVHEIKPQFSATLIATEPKKKPVTKKTASKPVAKKVAKPPVKKTAASTPKKSTVKVTSKKTAPKKK